MLYKSKTKTDRSEEHNRLSEIGWSKYRSSTSTFLSDCHPRFIKTQKENNKDPKSSIFVYFMRIRSFAAITYSFLKIGISNNKEIRFDFDSHRFKFCTLALIKCSSRKEALQIESRLLKKFLSRKHVPSIKLLSGGNSECFEDAVDLENQIMQEFYSHGGKKEDHQENPIDPRIHNLLLMLNYKDFGDFELERLLRGFRGNLKSLGVKVPSFDELSKHFHKKVKR